MSTSRCALVACVSYHISSHCPLANSRLGFTPSHSLAWLRSASSPTSSSSSAGSRYAIVAVGAAGNGTPPKLRESASSVGTCTPSVSPSPYLDCPSLFSSYDQVSKREGKELKTYWYYSKCTRRTTRLISFLYCCAAVGVVVYSQLNGNALVVNSVEGVFTTAPAVRHLAVIIIACTVYSLPLHVPAVYRGCVSIHRVRMVGDGEGYRW